MPSIQLTVDGHPCTVDYKRETVTYSREPLMLLNVYNVFITDAAMQPKTGDHFTFIWHPGKDDGPVVGHTGEPAAREIKQTIADAIVERDAAAGE